MWTYWYLQEGEIDVDPRVFVTANGSVPPVLHVDSHAPLHDDDGQPVTDDSGASTSSRTGTASRAAPRRCRRATSSRSTPTPPAASSRASPTSGARRCRTAWSVSRAPAPRYRQVRSGGVGAFTADNFPVFDYMRPNVFVAADSNHGYKMIAVGREIARVLGGEHSALLHPFRYERFATGDLHPVSNSPYPWS